MKEASLLFFCRKTKALFRGRFFSPRGSSFAGFVPKLIPLLKRCFCPTCPSPAGGSLTHSQALALSKRARDVTALLCCFFDPPRPSFAKEGSTFSPSPSSSGSGDVTALRCSEPLRSKVGGASKPSPYFAGWDRLGDGLLLICVICELKIGGRREICPSGPTDQREVKPNLWESVRTAGL